MANYTENYGLVKPTKAESANVDIINANMEDIDDIMHNTQISLAPAYDQNETYNTGDIVMYEMLMYKCKEDNVTGAWNASKWERTTAGESGGGADLDIYGEASGTAEASFSDGAEASLVECEIGIVPSQDLNGYSKPWAGGAGKNKNAYPYVAGTRVISDVNFTMNNDGTITLSGTATAQADYILNGAWASSANILPSGNYKISLGDNIPNGIELICVYNTTRLTPVDDVINAPNGITYSFIRIANGTNTNGIKLFPMIRESSAPSGFEPYSNICPISGHTDVTVTVASTSGGSGEDTTVALGRTVYGGTLDVTRGILTDNDGALISFTSANTNVWSGVATSPQGVTRFYTTPSYVGRTLIRSDSYELSPNYATETGIITTSVDGRIIITPAFGQGKTLEEFKALLATYPFNVEMTLATPQTYNLTPTQVLTLLGQNYVSHDGGGTISLVYIKKDSTIIPNPTGAEIPLTGLEIDGEKFKIESGGYHKALLWDSGSPTSGASYATDYTFLDNLSNYNQIILMVSTNGDRADANHQYSQQVWLDVEYILSSGTWHNVTVAGYGTRYFEASFTDSSFKIIQGGGEGGYLPTIFQIYGVRY